jgi:ankyrin repeat protein
MPLHLTARATRIEALEQLLAFGADPNLENGAGESLSVLSMLFQSLQIEIECFD